jgi:predicted GIY-YIG superfamily endonuclease
MARNPEGWNFLYDNHLFYRRDGLSDPWPGAYMITHCATGLFYIGSTGNLWKRKSEHEALLRHGRHHASKLQEAFSQSTMMTYTYWYSADAEQARIWEQQLLDWYWGNPLLINVGFVAAAPATGRPVTEHQREVASLTHRGKVVTDDQKEKMRQSRAAFLETPEGIALRDKYKTLMRKRVSIDGVVYSCAQEAAEKLGLTIDKITYRITRSANPNPNWFYVDEHGNRID